jgi:hypothetical protein
MSLQSTSCLFIDLTKESPGRKINLNYAKKLHRYKFKILPIEIHLSESSFHMVTMNEMVYLNSLAGKIQKSHNVRENLRAMAHGDYGKKIT